MANRREFDEGSWNSGGDIGNGPVSGFVGPGVAAGGRDLADVVHAFHRRGAAGGLNGPSSVELRRQAGAHRTERAEVLGQCAGVDVLDPENAVFRKIVGQRLIRAPIRRDVAELADHEAADVRAGGFIVVGVDAVVPDLRVGHRDDLAAVGGVGDDFLIARHRGVETDFPGGGAGGSEGNSLEGPTVF